jgi:hypothetical protein
LHLDGNRFDGFEYRNDQVRARLERATGERTEAKHDATVAGVDGGEGQPEDKDQRSYEEEWKAARYTEIDLAAIAERQTANDLQSANRKNDE